MPDSQGQATAQPAPQAPKQSRPPGELGGHTVMPWEQGDEAEPSNPTPAGSDPASTAAGGSSKNVPPPNAGKADGLGQGAGASTVKAADGMMPPASGPTDAKVPSKPPAGSAGAPAKANAANRPQPPLESTPLEGMENPPAAAAPLPTKVEAGDAPQDAMQGAPAVAQAATPQASRDALPSPEAGPVTPVAVAPSQATAPEQVGSGSAVDALLAELRPILEKALQAPSAQTSTQPSGPAGAASPGASPASSETTAS